MSSLSPKDRVPLCLFSFSDGRRCRTPRTGNHPHFCFYHAEKEARTQAAETLGKDLAYFFSGDYLSACDLSTALSRLIPAVVRGDIKPRLARTVAYMVQTLMQTIHLSQDEYINGFGADGWRKAVRHSVNSNHHYLFPPDPQPEPEPQHPETPQSQRTQPKTQQPNASSPQTTSRPPQSAPATPEPPSADRPSAANPEAALSVARELFPARPSSTSTQSASPAEACHPERSEGPCLDPASSAPAPSAQRSSARAATSATPTNYA